MFRNEKRINEYIPSHLELVAVYMILDRVRFGMKSNIWYRAYVKVFPNELLANEA